jgi:hypothetical protein
MIPLCCGELMKKDKKLSNLKYLFYDCKKCGKRVIQDIDREHLVQYRGAL